VCPTSVAWEHDVHCWQGMCLCIYMCVCVCVCKSCGDVNKTMIISDRENIHGNYYFLWKCLHCMFLHLHPVTCLIRPISSHLNFCVVYYKPFPIWKWRELVWLGWYAWIRMHTVSLIHNCTHTQSTLYTLSSKDPKFSLTGDRIWNMS